MVEAVPDDRSGRPNRVGANIAKLGASMAVSGEQSSSPADARLDGQAIAHYRILDKLGSGGMGVVYRAEDLQLGRQVALKFLADEIQNDPVALERFTREARSAASLNHPHISTIYEIGEHEGRRYIAMELLEGQSLQQHVGGRPLPLDEVLAVGADVADALAAAHAKGIVHRDIKPANIFLTARGVVKVVDFGLAKPVGRGRGDPEKTRLAHGGPVTNAGSAMGTIAYMSPEQARGEELDARTDLFSLGVVLYEMATGRQAFSGTTAVIFDGILNRTPPSPHSINGEVPPELEGIIARAIEKDRNQRFQSAEEIATDLRRLRRLSDPGLTPRDAAPPRPSRAWDGSGRAWPGSRAKAWQVAGIGLGLVIALGLVGLWQRRHVQALGEGDTVLVTDFANTTGDSVFDSTLKQALAVKLEESPFLAVAAESRVQETLRFMQRPPEAPLTREVARDVCQRQGITALIAGEIARLGSSYVVTLTAEQCGSGDVLAREQVEASRKEGVLGAVGTAAVALRGRLGESLASVQKLDKPIEQATTSSLEALRAFSLGDKERAKSNEAAALPLYRRAVELDPDFAMAHARLGTVYGNLGEQQLAREHRTRAFALRERVSDRERFYITAHYYKSVENDSAKAAEIYELWKRTYPRDSVPYINLGQIHDERGDDESALLSYLDAVRLAPMQRLGYENAVSIYIKQGKYDEARALLDREFATLGENPQGLTYLFVLDALAGDAAAMEADAAKVRGTMYEGMVLEMRATIAASQGRLGEYRRLLEEAVAVGERHGMAEWARTVASSRVLAEAVLGLASTARAVAGEVLAGEKPSEKALMNAGVGLALANDVAGAERAFRAAAQVAPGGTSAKSGRPDEATARAALDWKRGRAARAVALLDPFDPMHPKNAGMFGAMLVRGRALLALGRGAEAEAQFQAILDHRRFMPFDLAVPLAQVGVAEARARTGNAAGAREAYEALFETWKNADPDLPILAAARANYKRLGG